jgi:RNA polymerase sigma-70 factor (ECF subfamily)
MLNGKILTKRNSVELWLRTKDEKYFNQVYAQFQKGLFRHVQKIVKEEDVAHDIVSDTFCSVLQNVSQYNPSRGAFTTWVYNIAKNAAYAWINHERKQEYIRKESFTVLYSVRGIFAVDGFEDQELKEEFLQTEDNENIDGEILLGKVHQRVIYEIQQLSDVYRDCVYDREIRGLSYQTIANRRNLKLNTVKSKIRLGREIIVHQVIKYVKTLGIDPESLSIIIPGITKGL